ncbi:hypothetical protein CAUPRSCDRAFT_10874 [Caulochytrium protostelioides]|uniref:Uncharacterized protein n=1 Tax=Caulochytrium protostelioides TaxID=1555241 RepID=A0A4P9WVW5_9FUNG|nr:hypothetical protein CAUPRSCDRAFT_10874 [Caulochytrium protostelioides]
MPFLPAPWPCRGLRRLRRLRRRRRPSALFPLCGRHGFGPISPVSPRNAVLPTQPSGASAVRQAHPTPGIGCRGGGHGGHGGRTGRSGPARGPGGPTGRPGAAEPRRSPDRVLRQSQLAAAHPRSPDRVKARAAKYASLLQEGKISPAFGTPTTLQRRIAPIDDPSDHPFRTPTTAATTAAAATAAAVAPATAALSPRENAASRAVAPSHPPFGAADAAASAPTHLSRAPQPPPPPPPPPQPPSPSLVEMSLFRGTDDPFADADPAMLQETTLDFLGERARPRARSAAAAAASLDRLARRRLSYSPDPPASAAGGDGDGDGDLPFQASPVLGRHGSMSFGATEAPGELEDVLGLSQPSHSGPGDGASGGPAAGAAAASASASTAAAAAEVAAMAQRLDAVQRRLAESESRLSRARKEAEAKQAELQQAVDTAQKDAHTHARRVTELERRQTRLDEDLSHREQRIQDLETVVAKLKLQSRQLKLLVDERDAELKQTRTELERSRSHWEYTLSASELDKDKLEKRHAQEVAHWKSLVDDVQLKLHETNETVGDLTSQNDALEQTVAELQDRSSELQLALDALESRLHERDQQAMPRLDRDVAGAGAGAEGSRPGGPERRPSGLVASTDAGAPPAPSLAAVGATLIRAESRVADLMQQNASLERDLAHLRQKLNQRPLYDGELKRWIADLQNDVAALERAAAQTAPSTPPPPPRGAPQPEAWSPVASAADKYAPARQAALRDPPAAPGRRRPRRRSLWVLRRVLGLAVAWLLIAWTTAWMDGRPGSSGDGDASFYDLPGYVATRGHVLGAASSSASASAAATASWSSLIGMGIAPETVLGRLAETAMRATYTFTWWLDTALSAPPEGCWLPA